MLLLSPFSSPGSLCKRERPRPAAVCLAGREPYDPVLVYPEFALAGEPSREETSKQRCAV